MLAGAFGRLTKAPSFCFWKDRVRESLSLFSSWPFHVESYVVRDSRNVDGAARHGSWLDRKKLGAMHRAPRVLLALETLDNVTTAAPRSDHLSASCSQANLVGLANPLSVSEGFVRPLSRGHAV